MMLLFCTRQLTKGVEGKRVGMVTEGFDVDEAVATCVREAAKTLAAAGAIVEEVSIPLHKDGKEMSQYSNVQIISYKPSWKTV